MKKINKIIDSNLNKDFASVNNKIDYSHFTFEKKKSFKLRYVLVPSICLFLIFPLCLMLVPLLAMVRINDTPKIIKKTYSINEIKKIESESFKSLNKVTYPEITLEKKDYNVDEEYVSYINDFANKINSSLDPSSSNIVYSPLSLYVLLDFCSSLINDEETIYQFNNLLGGKETREKNYNDMYKNNYYCTDRGTTQMYNGLFVDSSSSFNPSLINSLTRKYVELFSLNFQNDNDIDKMISWIDQKLDEKNFIDREVLDIDDETILYLFSTLYYKNSWYTKFLKEDCYENVFYGKEKNTTVKYMHHRYKSDQLYDYDTYYAFRDYYNNSYSIKYLIPKDIEDNIHELIKGNNIFVDDINKRCSFINEHTNSESFSYIIDLSVPNFQASSLIDFSEILKNLGLKKAFNREAKSFNYAFTSLDKDDSVFLKYVKQKNTIKFDEDGTIAKTVSMAGIGKATSSSIIENTFSVRLNQPFIYIIEDSNGLPLYVGSVNQL